jgi:hypothetical protein
MGSAASAQNGFAGSKLLKSQLDTTIALFDSAVSVGLSIPNNKSAEQNTLEQVSKTLKDKKLERYFGELEKFVSSGSKVEDSGGDEIVDMVEPIGVGQAPVRTLMISSRFYFLKPFPFRWRVTHASYRSLCERKSSRHTWTQGKANGKAFRDMRATTQSLILQ